MNASDILQQRFEADRGHLRAVAYRILGSLSEADDAVQEAWLRLNRADTDGVHNLGGWLTTVVARVCLDMLRSRKSRREEPWDVQLLGTADKSAGADRTDRTDPEQQALLADSVGLALLVILDTLPPAERLAFVLHDMFAVPFDEIAPIVNRTPAAARQLASRARRRVRATDPAPERDLARQREVVDAWVAASTGGHFDELVALLDPEAVLRVDLGTAGTKLLRGAAKVAGQALFHARLGSASRLALVNGTIGLLAGPPATPTAVTCFTLRDGHITELHILADPDRLARLRLSVPEK